MIYTVLGEDGGMSPPSARAQNQNPSCNQGNVRCICDLMLSRTVQPWNLKPDLCMTKEYFTQLLQWREYISNSADENHPPHSPVTPLLACSCRCNSHTLLHGISGWNKGHLRDTDAWRSHRGVCSTLLRAALFSYSNARACLQIR